MNYEQAKKLKVGDKVRIIEGSYKYTKVGDICPFVALDPCRGPNYIIVLHVPNNNHYSVSCLNVELVEEKPTLKPLTLEQALDLKIGDKVVIIGSKRLGVVEGFCVTDSKISNFKDTLSSDDWIGVSSDWSGVSSKYYTISELSLPLPEPTPVEKIEELRKEMNDKFDKLKTELEKG